MAETVEEPKQEMEIYNKVVNKVQRQIKHLAFFLFLRGNR